MKLSKPQVNFLRLIFTNQNKKISIRKLGSTIYKCDRGTYISLKRLEEEDLVNIEMERKNLVVTLTTKGLQFLESR